MLLTAQDCFERFGLPKNESGMTLAKYYDQDSSPVPTHIYMNTLMKQPFDHVLTALHERDLMRCIKTWDGCFNIRSSKGDITKSSLHSWGLAIDINAAWNRYGHPPVFSKEFVACWEDNGFDWGGHWTVPDGMHFQLKRELVVKK